jgi:hypothetical protein
MITGGITIAPKETISMTIESKTKIPKETISMTIGHKSIKTIMMISFAIIA